MEEDITLYMKTFSSPSSSSMTHRQTQCYFQLLAVLSQAVSECALDGYTEANHKIEILQQAQETVATGQSEQSPEVQVYIPLRLI